MGATERKRIAKKLLAPLISNRKTQPPVYYAIWILHLFHKNSVWINADSLLNIFQRHPSQLVKRHAALGLSASGSRVHALALKEHFASAPPLLKTAILIGTKSLGDDERRYWLNSLKLTDPLERIVAFGHL